MLEDRFDDLPTDRRGRPPSTDRPSLPPRLRRLFLEPPFQPVDVETLPQEEEAASDLQHGSTRRLRHRDDVRSVHELVLEGMAARDLRRHAQRDQLLRGSLTLLAPRVGPDLVGSRRTASERGLGLLDRLPESEAGRADQAQRAVDSTSWSIATISSFWTSGSIFPSRASTSSHRATASIVARDPERTHDLSRGGSRLRHQPRHERDPLRVHDVVRDDRATGSRRSGCDQQVAEAFDDRLKEVAGEIAFEVGGVRQPASRRSFLIERFA